MGYCKKWAVNQPGVVPTNRDRWSFIIHLLKLVKGLRPASYLLISVLKRRLIPPSAPSPVSEGPWEGRRRRRRHTFDVRSYPDGFAKSPLQALAFDCLLVPERAQVRSAVAHQLRRPAARAAPHAGVSPWRGAGGRHRRQRLRLCRHFPLSTKPFVEKIRPQGALPRPEVELSRNPLKVVRRQ